MNKPAQHIARPARFAPSGWAVLTAMVLGSMAASSQAQSLTELFQAAKTYDAAYLAAKSQADSTQYKAAQAYAQRLPMVGLKGEITRRHLDSGQDVPTTGPSAPIYAAQGITSFNTSSTSKSLTLTAKQSLYDKSISATISQADLAAISADADLKAAEDDLLVRLTQAYFDVLASKDVLSTAQANKKGLSEQLASAKRNFEVGNATITDTREAQARFDLATAQEIAATNEVQVKGIALDQLVGQQNVKPRSLITPTVIPPLYPVNVEDWVAQTVNTPAVRKAEIGLRYAQLETTKAKAGHLPTADLVGGISKSFSDGGSITNKAAAGMGASIGVEVNVPIFAGFAVQNKVKETLVLEDKSQHDLDNAKRSTTLATRQIFFGLQSGQAQVKALEAAEASAKLALEATQLGYRVGVRVNKDVLDAQTAVSNTQKDLYKARYDVLVSLIRLRQASGTLKPEDLDGLNRMLSPQ
jgi:outer membrane protein